ncbi:MAG TPA: UvrD-helicase domain-containing protein [Gemmatimonadaceae bacterium]|nr:UvrD-helicase domain-containing protein [Gemmatimonadaceae bacterium]
MKALTDAQRAIILADGHLLVDAGAGSGKTTTVVQLICHQLGVALPAGEAALPLVATRLTIDQVAAITFTNAAAADLKRKLRQALRAGNRADLAAEVDAARIGTIHSFCGDLLREHALRARLRPAHRLLSDAESRVLLGDCAREALHAAIERGDLPGMTALLDNRRLKDIAEWVLSAASDEGRLERWYATREASGLREHELALLELARDTTARRRARMESEGLTDFDHMLGATRAMLRDDAVRRAVQRRIRLLIVDEFQDVDPVQRDIAELLAGMSDDSPDDASPKRTRLVLVGDPKQSIYRFRRADVTLWNAMSARFDAGAGRVLPLHENFRSKEAILGFVDTLAGSMLATPVNPARGRSDFEVPYKPLVARASGHEGDRCVELLVTPSGADGKALNANEVREMDAAGTAQRIRELHADGHGYGDIAILLAGWADVSRYETALRESGIPVYVQRGSGFWDQREILDCVLALRALRDPADHVAMVGFLRSPFVGVRDETLLALARARGSRGYLQAVDEALERGTLAADDGAEHALLLHARSLLSTYGALRDRLDTAELLRRLLTESGFLAAAALGEQGAQCVANIRKLLRLASSAPGRSLGEFLREVQESRARNEDVPLEPLHRERGDVVTITSIHGAKGLEWPIVFWCDLVREVNVENARFCAGRETFSLAAEALGEDGEAGKDLRHAELKAANAEEGLAEAYRLWYVASTRAKERLILSGIPSGTSSRKAPSPARKLAALLAEGLPEMLEYASDHGVTFHAVVRSLGRSVTRDQPSSAALPALPTAPPRVRVPSGSARLSASQLMAFDHDPAQWRRDYVERTGKNASRSGAILVGQVVHHVLERVAAGDDTIDVMALVEDAIGEGFSDEGAPGAESDAGAALRQALRARVEAAVGSAAWSEVVAAPGHRRELWFTRLLADGTVINGALDLAAPADGTRGARILDVKTGAASSEVIAERYQVQAAVYLDAVHAITGTADASFALLSLPSGEVVEVMPGQDALGLVERLRASASD